MKMIRSRECRWVGALLVMLVSVCCSEEPDWVVLAVEFGQNTAAAEAPSVVGSDGPEEIRDNSSLVGFWTAGNELCLLLNASLEGGKLQKKWLEVYSALLVLQRQRSLNGMVLMRVPICIALWKTDENSRSLDLDPADLYGMRIVWSDVDSDQQELTKDLLSALQPEEVIIAWGVVRRLDATREMLGRSECWLLIDNRDEESWMTLDRAMWKRTDAWEELSKYRVKSVNDFVTK